MRTWNFLETEMNFDVFRLVRAGSNFGNDSRALSANWTSSESLVDVCQGIDCIVHLAACNEVECSLNPEQALIVNGLHTQKLLNASIMAGVKRFIYISTAHVYGASLDGFVTEKTQERPINTYAITHRVAEDFVIEANYRGLIEGLVLRLSNVIGRPQNTYVDRWTLLANQLCREVVIFNTLTLKSSGEQVRNFISMRDTLRAMMHFIKLDSNIIGDGIFNVGGIENIKILDLAEIIVSRSKKLLNKSPIMTTNKSDAIPSTEKFCFSIEKLLSTGYVFESNIQNAIDETLLFCQEYSEVFGES